MESTNTAVDTLYRPALERAFAHALAHLANLDTASVAATATLDELRARFSASLANLGVEPGQVIDDLVADAAGGVIRGAPVGAFLAGWWVALCPPHSRRFGLPPPGIKTPLCMPLPRLKPWWKKFAAIG